MATATTELLDRWKKARGLESDYAAAQALGITRGSPSNWRHGRSHAAAATVTRMANDLGEDAGAWLALIESQRAATGEDRKAWAELARRLGAAATVAAVALFAAPLATVRAGHSEPVNPVCIMRNVRSRLRAALSALGRSWPHGPAPLLA